MDFQQVALAICGATATYVWYKRFCALSITDVPGPKNPSWTYGMSVPRGSEIILSHEFWNRTQMVVGMRTDECPREEALGRIRNRGSLEWDTRRTLFPMSQA